MTDVTLEPQFVTLPDLAVRSSGGSVIAATDDFYGDRENLIRAEEPEAATRMNGRGWVVDAWETGRRRSPGNETIVVRLGIPGTIAGITVDTTYAGGGYPPEIALEAVGLYGYPDLDELEKAEWTSLVERSEAGPHQRNHYEVADGRVFTHVRLHVYPDGNVARLRVHGTAVPDVRMITGLTDIASLGFGAYVLESSGAADTALNALSPGRGRSIREGWETRRNRGTDPDYLRVRLGSAGVVRYAEIDTLNYIANAPGRIRLLGRRAGEEKWREIVPLTDVLPDASQLRRGQEEEPVDEVLLEMHPDGGVARLRVFAELDPEERAAGVLRWFNLLPDDYALAVLINDHGVDPGDARAAVAARPLGSADASPAVKSLVSGTPWDAIPS